MSIKKSLIALACLFAFSGCAEKQDLNIIKEFHDTEGKKYQLICDSENPPLGECYGMCYIQGEDGSKMITGSIMSNKGKKIEVKDGAYNINSIM